MTVVGTIKITFCGRVCLHGFNCKQISPPPPPPPKKKRNTKWCFWCWFHTLTSRKRGQDWYEHLAIDGTADITLLLPQWEALLPQCTARTVILQKCTHCSRMFYPDDQRKPKACTERVYVAWRPWTMPAWALRASEHIPWGKTQIKLVRLDREHWNKSRQFSKLRWGMGNMHIWAYLYQNKLWWNLMAIYIYKPPHAHNTLWVCLECVHVCIMKSKHGKAINRHPPPPPPPYFHYSRFDILFVNGMSVCQASWIIGTLVR